MGIGTSAAAMTTHGINTTTVELDSFVLRMARKYFGLPSSMVVIIEDATKFVQDERGARRGSYDYIIHDVFTGGAEPTALFNSNFLDSLKEMLRDDGFIAMVCYAIPVVGSSNDKRLMNLPS